MPAVAVSTELPLAFAVVASSSSPLLLLDGTFHVIAASASFCTVFGIDPATAPGKLIFQLGQHEWNLPKLRSLLTATASGDAAIAAYEMGLNGGRQGARDLVLHARKLDYVGEDRLLLAISDVTEIRASTRAREDLLRDKTIQLEELQHRVANSLQIIASVLMQSAKRVQSDEARHHLQAAHHRVMSVAEVQRQLMAVQLGDVPLRPYLVQLCLSIEASMIPDPDRISLKANVDGSVVPADTAMSIGLIVTELVINALKHAFPDQGRGGITVGYRARGRSWTLAVTDNGTGMPAAADKVAKGLGTSIVEAIAKRLEATIRIESAAPGAQVSIIHRATRRSPAPARPLEAEPAL